MRLTHIHEVISANLLDLQLKATKPGEGFLLISNLDEVRQAAEMFSEVKPLRGHVEQYIKALDTLHSGNPTIRSVKQWEELQKHQNNLFGEATRLRNFLQALLGQEGPNEIAIRLPDGISSLKDLETVVHKYHLLDNLVRRLTKHGIEFKGVDVGTSWLVVVAGASSALFAVLRIWRAILEIREAEAEVEMAHVRLKAASHISDDIIDMIDVRKKLRGERVAALKRDLVDRAMGEGEIDPEAANQLDGLIDSLSRDIGQGAQMICSLAAPEEVKVDLPNSMRPPAEQLGGAESKALSETEVPKALAESNEG